MVLRWIKEHVIGDPEIRLQRQREREKAEGQRLLAIQQERADRRREQEQEMELQEKVLAMLQEGKVPDLHLNINVPFRLQKAERWIFAINGVGYAEKRIKREIHGRSAGASFRVMKGVSVRTGASRGTPVEVEELTHRGTGTFAISTKHVFFQGDRTFRIPLSKIVSVRYDYSVGALEIVRDRASALPEYFGLDNSHPVRFGDFLVQLLLLLPSLDFGRGEPEVQSIETYMMSGDIGADDMLEHDSGVPEHAVDSGDSP